MRHQLSAVQALARLLSVLVFIGAALLALVAAQTEVAQEAYISWGDRYVRALLIFGAANVVAAGLAALPGRSATLRLLGVLSLVPAVMLMSEYKGSPDDKSLAIGAIALVVAGGSVAGVLRWSPRR